MHSVDSRRQIVQLVFGAMAAEVTSEPARNWPTTSVPTRGVDRSRTILTHVRNVIGADLNMVMNVGGRERTRGGTSRNYVPTPDSG